MRYYDSDSKLKSEFRFESLWNFFFVILNVFYVMVNEETLAIKYSEMNLESPKNRVSI